MLNYLFLCLLSLSLLSQTPNELMKLYSENGHNESIGSPFNGAVLIAKNGKVLLKKAYGFENYQTKKQLTTDSKFLIGSLTKQFTALLIMQEVEKGKIDLNKEITHYLPNYTNSVGSKITVHQLLSHTSGLPHYDGLFDLSINQGQFFNTKLTPNEYVELISKLLILNEPGTHYQYSSFGYVLLGAILENVTGFTYDELIEKRISKPLNLKNTGYASNEFVENEIIKDYYFQEHYGLDYFFSKGKGDYQEAPFRDQSTTYSTGGMYSTIDDLYRWTIALKNNELLSSKWTEKMMTPNLEGYCYGFWKNHETWLRRNPSAKHYQHSGSQTGFSSQIAIYENGTTIIWLSNVKNVNTINLTKNLYLAANGINLDDFKRDLLRPEIEEDLDEFLSDGGLPAFYDYYNKLSMRADYRINPDALAIAELVKLYNDQKVITEIVEKHLDKGMIESLNGINQLGYVLLEKKLPMLAIKCFNINLKNYPFTPNTYDSLGEAYYSLNDYKNAKINFRKAIELGKISESRNLKAYHENLKKVN